MSFKRGCPGSPLLLQYFCLTSKCGHILSPAVTPTFALDLRWFVPFAHKIFLLAIMHPVHKVAFKNKAEDKNKLQKKKDPHITFHSKKSIVKINLF